MTDEAIRWNTFMEDIKDEDNGFEDTDDAFYSFEPSLTDHLMAFVENHKDEFFC